MHHLPDSRKPSFWQRLRCRLIAWIAGADVQVMLNLPAMYVTNPWYRRVARGVFLTNVAVVLRSRTSPTAPRVRSPLMLPSDRLQIAACAVEPANQEEVHVGEWWGRARPATPDGKPLPQ